MAWKKQGGTTAFRDVYQEITNRILEQMETAARWQKPWNPGIAANGKPMGRPVSATSGKAYRGINVPLLWGAGYSSPLWATYKAWGEKGGQVRKGEKGTTIIFWKFNHKLVTGPTGDEVERTSAFARAYCVFNAEQVDGVAVPAPAPELPLLPDAVPAPVLTEEERLKHVDEFIRATGADIRHGGDRAFYMPSQDRIQMPNLAQFIGTETSGALESYYSTLCHETTHWTGHKSRCDRDFSGRFGNQAYAAEELVAELGAAYLCADLGISNEPRPDHAQYLKNWIEVLKNDKRAIFTAASKAEKACDFLHGLQATGEDEEPEEIAEAA